MEYQGKDIPVSDIFDCISGNAGLTAEMIYQNIDLTGKQIKYEVLSSSTIDRTKMGYIPKCEIKDKIINTFEDKEGMQVIRNGKAGKAFYLKPGRYTLNDHAYILFIRDDCKYDLDLKWFIYQYQRLLYDYASFSDNATWNKTGFFKYATIDVPDISYQKEIVHKYQKIENYAILFKTIINKIKDIQKRIFTFEYKKYQAKQVPAKALFKIISGNSGLTEEYLYSVMLDSKVKEYKVLTGSVDIENVQKTHLCSHPKNPTKKINIWEGGGIHVVRKGKAGHVNYLPCDKYTLNDDAYLLILKKGILCKLSLKWVSYTCKHIFWEHATNADNGTWNKTSFFKYAMFDIPEIDEQIDIVKRFEKLNRYEKKISLKYEKATNILECEPVT